MKFFWVHPVWNIHVEICSYEQVLFQLRKCQPVSYLTIDMSDQISWLQTSLERRSISVNILHRQIRMGIILRFHDNIIFLISHLEIRPDLIYLTNLPYLEEKNLLSLSSDRISAISNYIIFQAWRGRLIFDAWIRRIKFNRTYIFHKNTNAKIFQIFWNLKLRFFSESEQVA